MGRSLTPLALLLALVLAYPALPRAQQSATPPETSALAHRVLESALQTDGISAAAPWHLKASIHLHPPGAPRPIDAQLEEWFASPDHWRRTYSSSDPALNGTEWSLTPHRRYLVRRGYDSLARLQLDLRIAGALTDPLARAAGIPSSAPLELKIIPSARLTLNCISVVTPDSPAPYPGMCFDRANRLRLLSTLSSAAEFEHYETFQHRAVPRSIRILVNGTPYAEIDVAALDPLPSAAIDVLKPPQNAIPEPILLQPGDSAPISTFETAAHPGLRPDGYPYRDLAFICVVIGKDGRARLDRGLSVAANPAILDSLEIAVHRWRFKPYLIGGRPADIAIIAPYPFDGHSFVPLFQHPHRIQASDMEAYLQAGRAAEGIAFGLARARRSRR